LHFVIIFAIFGTYIFIMEAYIKYKRIKETFNLTNSKEFENDLQIFLDKLIQDGWNIINYNEQYFTVPDGSAAIPHLVVVILAGKTSNLQKNVL
jgi:hypothetical protein